MAPRPRVRTILLLVFFNGIVSLALLEAIFLLLLHAPTVTAVSPALVRRLAQQVYRHFNRGLIQFDPACARYDPAVTYTLRPGHCSFGNLEFESAYTINHLGLRDDERSLEHPSVVVLGDSHAMGWGVDQNQTFPQVLEAAIGQPVLNAGVSSYATVREMRMLDRIDTSQLQVLVIQYSDNDLPENQTFRHDDDTLPITPEPAYDDIVRHYASQRSYFPGKYVFRLFMKVSGLETPEPDQLKMETLPAAEEADLFLNAVAHAGHTSLRDVDVIVLAVNQDLDQPKPFIAALAERSRFPSPPSFVRRLLVLDTSRLLKPSDFYVLDDHMRASGHRAIGLQLASLVSDLREERKAP